MTPSLSFLAEVEHTFSLAYPTPFHAFCTRCATTDLVAEYAGLRRGAFIRDVKTLEAINAQIGGEEWGDYERILAGKERPKSGARLWGGLLPFYFESPKKRRAKKLATDIYGFSADEPGSDKVLVWSVHTIVHAYPTFAAWLASMKR